MTTKTDPVAEARQEAAEAAELAATLEEQIRDGDDSITAADLAEAESLGKFAQLRAEAAERKVKETKRSAAIAASKKLAKDLENVDDSDAALVDAWVATVDALRALNAAAAARKDRIWEFINEIDQVKGQLNRDAGVDIDSAGILGPKYGNMYGFQVPAAGIDVLEVPLGLVLASAAHEALDQNAMQELASRINSKEDDLARSSTGQSVNGWPEAIRSLKEKP